MVALARYEQLILRITRGLLLLSLAIPLVYFFGFVFPFVTAKVFFVRSVILLALAGYLTLVMIAPERYLPRRSVLLLMTGAWFVWLIVSVILGVDPAFSWWGNYERMGGVFTLLHYGALFVMMSALFRDAREWRAVWWTVIGVGFLVMLGAVIQRFVPSFLFGGTRAASTLGNPIYLAVHAGYVAFIGAIVILRADGHRLEGSRTHKDSAIRIFSLATIALALLAFVWSDTRAAWLGVGVALVWMAVWLVVIHDDRRVRRGALAVLALILVSAGVFTWGGSVLERVPGLGRVAQFSLGDTAETRLRTWRVGLEAAKDHPIVGWGWMNFGPAYDLHYDPDQLKHGLQETWLDQAHNVLVDVVATTGIVGLLLYLVWWVVLLWTLFRAYRHGRVRAVEWALVSGLLVFHFVQNLFSFDQPTSYVMLFTIAAWVAAQDVGAAPLFHLEPFTPRRALQGAAFVLVAAVLMVYYTNSIPARANRLQTQANAALQRGEVGLWFGLYEQALAMRTPHTSDIRSQMAAEFLERKGAILPLDRRSVDAIVTVITQEAERDANEHPKQVRQWLTYGKLLSVQHEAFKAEHPDAGPAAVRVYERARTLSPRRQQVGLLYASAVLSTLDVQKARTIIYGVRALSPGIAEVHILAAELFERAGLFEDALPSYEAAIRISGSPQSLFRTPDEWQKVGLLHIEHGDPLRGSWMLETMVSCVTGRVSWRPCVEEGDMTAFPMFRPSRKAFGALVLYYRKKGDLEKSTFYDDFARSYYADFTVQEGPAKAVSGT